MKERGEGSRDGRRERDGGDEEMKDVIKEEGMENEKEEK